MSCTGDAESNPINHSADIGISAPESVEVVNEAPTDHLNKPAQSVEDDVTATPYGPLTESEAERLQREANEDTTRSEDLRQFLKEMREKLKEEQQKQQLSTAGSTGASYGPPMPNPSASQYSLTGPQPQPSYDKEADQPRRLSAAYMVNHGPNKLTSQVHRPSLTDLTNPEAPPDGGWGWIVVLSSFCCMILVDGVSLSYGLLLSPQCGYSSLKVTAPSPSLIQSTRERILRPKFGSCVPISELGEAMDTQSRALLLTPGALLLGVYLLLGPLISALTNQFDFRPVAMTGAALSTIALLLASFADNIEQLIAAFGLLGGIGFALIYLPAIATVGHWFQQQRPLAVGLALCGSGVGCLLGAQAVPRLVDWFTWRGTLILMAAASFQCMSVIVLFRPLEVHMRISQVQRVKRAEREAARIAAAARRAEAERMLFEARQRKRLAAAKMAAAQQLEYQKQLQQKQQQLVRARLSANTMMVGSIPKADLKRTEGMLQARGGALHRGSGARPRMGTVITRSGRGGRVIAMNPPGHVVVGLNSARSHATTSDGWLRNRTNSGRGSQGKPAAGRRVVVYRGSIMQRIIEEKRRQRTISVGSLDGMVITRDNELIAASQAPNYDRPLLSCAAINRISEAVARKIEVKMQQQLQPTTIDGQGNSTGGTGAPTQIGSRLGLSRSQLRVNLPLVVQEYIHSQLSLSFQQQHQLQPPPSYRQSISFIGPPSTVGQPRPSSLTDQVVASEQELAVCPSLPITTSIDVAATDVPAGYSTPAKATNPPVIASYMNWTSSNQLDPSAPISGLPNDTADQPPAPANSVSKPLQLNDVICSSTCPSECVSLRHNVSDLSLESRLHGGGVSLVHTRRAPLEGIDLLDDEIKADIRARIRRELARPQYKKDLFFTGSVLQLGCGQANLDTATSGSPAVLPHSVPEKHCSFVASPTGPLVSVNTAVAQRVPGTRTSVQLVCQPNDSSVQELHNSQTNLSLATSVGAGGTSFIPPAPCPTVQPQTPSLPVGPMTTATTLLDSVDSYNPQPKAVNLIGPVPNGSPDMLSTNMCPFIGQDNQPATPDHDLQSVGPIHAGEVGDVDLEGRGDQDDLLVDVEDDVDLDGEDVDETGVGDDVDVDVEDDDVDEDEEFDATQSPRTCCYRCPFVCNFPDISCFSTTVDMLAPMRSFIHELLSPWILASPTFTFMLLSSTATMMGLVIPYLMLPDLLVELNWPLGDSGFALSALAVGNTVGRLIATLYIEKAWSATYRWADCLWLNNASLLVTSLTVFFMPSLRTHYPWLVLVCIIFGFASAVFVSLKSILVVELLGLERLTNSFGYMLLFQGFAAAIGPPVAGCLRDLQLNRFAPHDIMTAHRAPVHHASAMGFYFSGASLFLALLFACPLRWLSRRELPSLSPESMPHPYYGNPAFEFGPGHTALDANLPSLSTDCELHPGSPEFAIGVTHIPDAFAAPVGDHTYDPVGISFTASRSVDQATNASIQAGQVSTIIPMAPILASSNSAVVPGLVDVLPVTSSAMTVGIDTNDAALPTLQASSNAEDLSVYEGLPTGIRGVGALVIPASGVPVPVMPNSCTVTSGALSTQGQMVEVVSVQEEPGLEPVAEEEEEEEEEDEEEEEYGDNGGASEPASPPLPPVTIVNVFNDNDNVKQQFDVVTVLDPREDETRPALTTFALSEESVPNQKRRKRKKLPRTGEQSFTCDCSVSSTAVPVMEVHEQEQSVVPTKTRMEEANT